MTNPEHFNLLTRSVEDWNQWRMNNTDTQPYLVKADLREVNLRGADLSKADLRKADLRGTILHWANLDGATLSVAKLYGTDLRGATLRKANLNGADLRRASLYEARLSGATLSHASLSYASLYGATLSEADLRAADLSGADLSRADLSRATLPEANLEGATLSEADLSGADLTGAKLERSILVKTTCNNAIFTGCQVHGISAWDLQLEKAQQTNLIITPWGEPAITVDDLEVAQFVYLLLKNEKIRKLIDTIGGKGVLILGRFIKERKVVLDAIRVKLRELGFVPMMFDFEKPTQRDFTETIRTLAGMSRFIVADITNPKSSPLELQALMPDYMVPFVPIIHEGEEPFEMFRDLKQKYDSWVLDVLKYDSTDKLIDVFGKAIVEPALKVSEQLVLKKAEAIRERHVKDYS